MADYGFSIALCLPLRDKIQIWTLQAYFGTYCLHVTSFSFRAYEHIVLVHYREISEVSFRPDYRQDKSHHSLYLLISLTKMLTFLSLCHTLSMSCIKYFIFFSSISSNPFFVVFNTSQTDVAIMI